MKYISIIIFLLLFIEKEAKSQIITHVDSIVVIYVPRNSQTNTDFTEEFIRTMPTKFIRYKEFYDTVTINMFTSYLLNVKQMNKSNIFDVRMIIEMYSGLKKMTYLVSWEWNLKYGENEYFSTPDIRRFICSQMPDFINRPIGARQ